MPQSPNKDNRYYRQLECWASTALFIRIGENSWERKLFSFQFHINVFLLTWFITNFTFTWSPWPWFTTFAMYSIRCTNIKMIRSFYLNSPGCIKSKEQKDSSNNMFIWPELLNRNKKPLLYLQNVEYLYVHSCIILVY